MKYIKLNDNKNHLSLGNIINTIKKNSINKSSALQTDIFCLLFNIDNISETTVNNYCTGYRQIGNDYKQIYLNYKKKYINNKSIFINTFNNIITIMEGIIYDLKTIEEINDNKLFERLIIDLYNIAKNDKYYKEENKILTLKLINNQNYYEAFIDMLFFSILEKKQPLYENDLIDETIFDILKQTNISVVDLKEYLEIQFKEGISLIPSLKLLAKNNNPYALFELGNLEYNGLISGTPNYEMSFYYHKKAANYNHPTSYWMLAHMILNNKIIIKNESEINLAWNYLLKAKELNSVSALNTIGLCYLKGQNPTKEIDKEKATKYFKRAAEKNYTYAFNNLGKIYEEEKNYKLALNYYLKSANKEESWACNKVGEFYRMGLGVEKNDKEAYKYYNIGLNSPIKNLYPWNIYNLINYYYLDGNPNLGIKKDLNKCINLLSNIKENPISEELLLDIYYQKYLIDNNQKDLENIEYYLSKINDNPNFDIKKKKEIETALTNLKYKINTP